MTKTSYLLTKSLGSYLSSRTRRERWEKGRSGEVASAFIVKDNPGLSIYEMLGISKRHKN